MTCSSLKVRAGATLLFDSDPPAEEAETVLKASAFIDALRVPRTAKTAAKASNDAGAAANKGCAGKRILLIDHQVLHARLICRTPRSPYPTPVYLLLSKAWFLQHRP